MTDAPIRTYPDLIAAIRARKAALGLSDCAIDEVAGLASGHYSKIVTGERGLGATTIGPLMDALGVSFIMVEDAEKMARLGEIDRRHSSHVRNNHRVGREQLARVRPVVLRELARKGGLSWWAGQTAEQRQAHIAKLNAARAAKRQAGLRNSA